MQSVLSNSSSEILHSCPPNVEIPMFSLAGRVRTAEESFGEATSSTVTRNPPVLKKKKTLAALKRKAAAAKRNKKPLPGPILLLDVRRTYPRILIDAFNSCDVRRLEEVLDKYCVDDIIAVHRYSGLKNPYGKNLTRLKGRHLISGLWQQLFKSSPDFLFVPLETRAFYDSDYRVVVACQYTFSGTRMRDVRYAGISNEPVLEEKLSNSGRYSTDEQQLLNEIVNQCTQKYSPCTVLSNAFPGADSMAASTTRSLFAPGDLIIEASPDDQSPASFCVGSNPLTEKLSLNYKGTLIIYLNDSNRIYKYEFVYIAMHEVGLKG